VFGVEEPEKAPETPTVEPPAPAPEKAPDCRAIGATQLLLLRTMTGNGDRCTRSQVSALFLLTLVLDQVGVVELISGGL
jgi:hypothetical protein